MKVELEGAVEMPARRISSSSSPLNLALYDVIGEDGSGQFVAHTGLAANSGSQQVGTVPVIDIEPPLRNGQPMRADVVGIPAITFDEQQKILTFINRHENEHQAATSAMNRSGRNFPQAYCILPHATPLTEADGRYSRIRFSCAGFVFEAYKRAGIHLVNENNLPAVDLAKIQKAYPNFSDFLNNSGVRVALGLSGNGPWPVMLCGYLFHSLDRSAQAIRHTPYIAKSGDEVFP